MLLLLHLFVCLFTFYFIFFLTLCKWASARYIDHAIPNLVGVIWNGGNNESANVNGASAATCVKTYVHAHSSIWKCRKIYAHKNYRMCPHIVHVIAPTLRHPCMKNLCSHSLQLVKNQDNFFERKKTRTQRKYWPGKKKEDQQTDRHDLNHGQKQK